MNLPLSRVPIGITNYRESRPRIHLAKLRAETGEVRRDGTAGIARTDRRRARPEPIAAD